MNSTTAPYADPFRDATAWLCGVSISGHALSHADDTRTEVCLTHTCASVVLSALLLFVSPALWVPSQRSAPEYAVSEACTGHRRLRVCVETGWKIVCALCVAVCIGVWVSLYGAAPRGYLIAAFALTSAWLNVAAFTIKHLRSGWPVPDYLLWWLLACLVAGVGVCVITPSGPKVADTAITVSWSFQIIIGGVPLGLLASFAVMSRCGRRMATNVSPRDTAAFVSRMLFLWMNGIMRLGYARPLDASDLPALPADDAMPVVLEAFDEAEAALKRESSTRPTLARVLIRAFRGVFLRAIGFKLVFDTIQFAGPMVLHGIIQYLDDVASDRSPPRALGYGYAVAMFACSLLQTLLLHQYFFRVFKVGQQLRCAVVMAVFRKSLKLSLVARSSQSVGNMVNLMSTDAKRLQDLQTYLITVVSGPWQIILAMVLLWFQIGPAVFAGVAVMLLFFPINALIARFQQRLQSKVMGIKDTRINYINEALQAFRMMKYNAWEHFFEGRIVDTRAAELQNLFKYQLLSQASEVLWLGLPLLVTLSSIGAFAYVHNGPPAPSALFTALALFQMLRFPMSMVPTVVTSLIAARVSLQRLQQFLDAEEVQERALPAYDDRRRGLVEVTPDAVFDWGAVSPASNAKAPGVDAPTDAISDDTRLTIEAGSSEGPSFSLHNIGFSVQPGKFITVVGAVGSGKSSLLQAVLGEMRRVSGHASIIGNIAYVPQAAFIMNATVKENIIFGRVWNERRYAAVVDACELTPDIRILPAGDNTEIGEKGVNLSGGQQARVALARAVYADADVYLLDDVLAAVDAHVGARIYHRCLRSFLKGKTRILVTHGLHFTTGADSILVMRDGAIHENGSYAELIVRSTLFASLAATAQLQAQASHSTSTASGDVAVPNVEVQRSPQTTDAFEQVDLTSPSAVILEPVSHHASDEPEDGARLLANDGQHSTETSHATPAPVDAAVAVVSGRQVSTEARELGKVKWSVYASYARAVGGLPLAALLGSLFALYQGIAQGGSAWLSFWSARVADGTGGGSWYLQVYVIFNVASLVVLIGARIAVAIAALRASRDLHYRLLHSLLRTPLSFMDTTPIGRILNRCSQDVNVVDEQLPETYATFASCFCTVAGTVILVCAVTPLFLVAIIPLAIFYIWTQRYYVATSRELQRLDSVSRSPIFAHFGETLQGIVTVRAFADQPRFWSKAIQLLGENIRAYFTYTSSNRWLAVRLETVGTIITASAAFFAIVAADAGSSSSFAAFAGLSISTALGMTQTLNWLVRMASDAESQTVAVERIEEYAHLTPEADVPAASATTVPPAWPHAGSIRINNLRLQYRKETPEVLRGITCDITAGEHIGICGRTGAGKSSFVSALFRTADVQSGLIEIDGVDIARVPLRTLRERLTLIPQTPVLFAGSVRRNLDVVGGHSDDEVWRALDLVGMRDTIASMAGQLDAEVADGGANFSAGQRQLLTIARALLRKSRIVVLDEASSSVDVESDALLGRAIETQFGDCTTLTIAHRLHSIMRSTRIMVLRAGVVAEMDRPDALLARRDSDFARLAAETHAGNDSGTNSASDSAASTLH